MSVQDPIPMIEVIHVEPAPPTPEELAEAEAAKIQAMSEGVEKDSRSFVFMEKRFRLADKVGLMPLMKFAHLASKGMDTDDDYMVAMAAIYAMIRDVIHPEEWEAFQDHATETKAGEEELLGVVREAVEIMTARPTRPDSDSSASPPDSTPNSTDTRWEGLVPVGGSPE